MYVGVGCFVSRQLGDGSTIELGGVKRPILSDWQPYSYHVRFCQSLSYNSPTLANFTRSKEQPCSCQRFCTSLSNHCPIEWLKEENSEIRQHMCHGSEAHGVGRSLNQKWWMTSASLEASKDWVGLVGREGVGRGGWVGQD